MGGENRYLAQYLITVIPWLVRSPKTLTRSRISAIAGHGSGTARVGFTVHSKRLPLVRESFKYIYIFRIIIEMRNDKKNAK